MPRISLRRAPRFAEILQRLLWLEEDFKIRNFIAGFVLLALTLIPATALAGTRTVDDEAVGKYHSDIEAAL